MRCHGDGHVRVVLSFPATCKKKHLPHRECSCNEEEGI